MQTNLKTQHLTYVVNDSERTKSSFADAISVNSVVRS